ncbi:MAG: RagB/SusD family nutrient uptake outer membrane protein [Prevotella sp.]|nr:RagB/SusD family nutrient uptake outer membrane protein [Prevotella sp.]
MKKYIGLSILALSMGLTSCNDFLDELPDNRTEANTEEKIQKLLVAAYPDHDHMAFTEYASDNVDDMGSNNPYTERALDEYYSWVDESNSDTYNQAPEDYWQDLYQCIETANMALEGIEAIGGATTVSLKEAEAEALLCRAYAHFMLVNLFAPHYNANDDTSLGVSYVTETEKELNPQYQRETVKENYAHIAEDLEAALPYVGDSYYQVPKYHFNKNAAYAFAARFYLYYGQPEQTIYYASQVLGTNPGNMLRNYQYIASLPREWNSGEGAIPLFMIETTQNNNLLLLTSKSNQGIWFGPYYTGKRYSHNEYIGVHETISAITPLFGVTSSNSYATYFAQPFRYSGTNLNTWLTWRLPYMFEITNPVSQTGYRRTVHNAFTGDELLLDRAEAYVLTKQYDLAAKDLTIWARNINRTVYTRQTTLTPEGLQAAVNAVAYSYDEDGVRNTSVVSTFKKHLNPKFAIDEEGSVQECMLQAVIAFRRVETLHEGKRWFDIKRWGIEIPRRVMTGSGNPDHITDWLVVDDLRRAIQIPQSVREAGYTPNPRETDDDTDAMLIPNSSLLKE